jgi:hypothetical protein
MKKGPRDLRFNGGPMGCLSTIPGLSIIPTQSNLKYTSNPNRSNVPAAPILCQVKSPFQPSPSRLPHTSVKKFWKPAVTHSIPSPDIQWKSLFYKILTGILRAPRKLIAAGSGHGSLEQLAVVSTLLSLLP